MKYKLLDEQGTFSKELIEPGLYNFEIARAEELISKNNVPMLKITLKLNDDKDNACWIVDYLSAKTPIKIKMFMDSVDLGELYNKAELVPEDCLGRKGNARIVHEYSEKYGIQMVVSSYISGGEPNV